MPNKITKEELRAQIKEYMQRIDELPQHAKLTSLNNYDLYSVLILILACLESEE